MTPNTIYNKVFKGLRVACLTLSCVLFAGSVGVIANGISNDNMEQVMDATPLAFLSLATIAAAEPNLKKVMHLAGFLSPSGQYLIEWLEKSGKLSSDTLSKYKSGKLRLVNADFYIAYQISSASAGITIIMNESTTKATGITNIDKGRLPIGVNAAIDRILIGYVTHASETDPKALANYDSVVSSWPAGLVNGYLHIKVDGQLVQDPIPTELCGSMADTQAGRGQYESYQLKNPIILPDDKQISLELDLPVASFASNKHHVKVWMLGSKTKQKSDY